MERKRGKGDYPDPRMMIPLLTCQQGYNLGDNVEQFSSNVFKNVNSLEMFNKDDEDYKAKRLAARQLRQAVMQVRRASGPLGLYCHEVKTYG
jgi:hypothetical protein